MGLGDLIRKLSFAHTWAGANARLLRIGRFSLLYRKEIQDGRWGVLRYRCNICGEPCETPMDELQRENLTCLACGSSVRMRTLIHLLSEYFFDESLSLPEFPVRKDIRGLGLSDAQIYATPLGDKFNYLNTFYHQEPSLDIINIDPSLEGTYGFIFSSEVFEHVPPPVEEAFENAYRLLKPGGALICSVPWVSEDPTVEHYPDLYDYEIIEHSGKHMIRNVTRDGREQLFNSPQFHGGEGLTLEMRVFSRRDLTSHLQQAGFREISFCETSQFQWGIYWSRGQGFPLIARKPVAPLTERDK